MSERYVSILWNKQKKYYDRYLWFGITLFILSYSVLQMVLRPTITIETLIIRVTALTAFVLLHFILAIGPLSRMDQRFLPLLYNRRHAGVSMFLLALIHGLFCIVQFHSLGDVHPLVSLFVSNQKYSEISQFPFQTLGFLALIILFLMASTSHDFWLKNLGPRIWKSLHMGVYVAYGLIIIHVVTGALQYESHPVNWILLILGFAMVSVLHLIAGLREVRRIRYEKKRLQKEGFYEVGPIGSFEESHARTVFVNGQNIAIFKYQDQLSAVHNVCKHQMGPLGEGRIIDGCITCPWHGYQYRPQDGQSPPPFTEKVKTYALKIVKDTVWVNPIPNPEGTFVEPAKITKV